MVERQWFVLAITAAAVILMLITFPTRSRARKWIEARLIRVDETRQFGSQ
jgi:hypothetical protein